MPAPDEITSRWAFTLRRAGIDHHPLPWERGEETPMQTLTLHFESPRGESVTLLLPLTKGAADFVEWHDIADAEYELVLKRKVR